MGNGRPTLAGASFLLPSQPRRPLSWIDRINTDDFQSSPLALAPEDDCEPAGGFLGQLGRRCITTGCAGQAAGAPRMLDNWREEGLREAREWKGKNVKLATGVRSRTKVPLDVKAGQQGPWTTTAIAATSLSQ